MSITLRDYRDSDRDGVIALWLEAYPEITSGHYFSEMLDRQQKMHPTLFVVADRDGTIVGTTVGGYDGIRAWIYMVAVAKSDRRTGLGSKLIRDMEDRLKSLGTIKIALQILDGREDLKTFYGSLGYEIEPRLSLSKNV